ncbi:MAG: PqqD family protein [Faecalibacterium sp.]|nr:PqqD family protein [Faecalibacterium sp.]
MQIRYTANVSWQSYFGQTYIFNEANGLVYRLEGTAQAFWLALEQQPCFEQVLVQLQTLYPTVLPEQLRQDMTAFAHSLQQKALVQISQEVQP